MWKEMSCRLTWGRISRARLRASLWAASPVWVCGTERFTSPNSSARSPPTRRPVKISSFAMAKPTVRGNLWLPPDIHTQKLVISYDAFKMKSDTSLSVPFYNKIGSLYFALLKLKIYHFDMWHYIRKKIKYIQYTYIYYMYTNVCILYVYIHMYIKNKV